MAALHRARAAWLRDAVCEACIARSISLAFVRSCTQLTSTEQCDDGNTMSGDGCDSLCQWEIILK